MLSKYETGEQLFGRILNNDDTTQVNESNNLNKLNIDCKLFENGIERNDIFEIFGKEGCGKSELMLHFMSRCLLPAKWMVNTTDNKKVLIDLTEYSASVGNSLEKSNKVLFINVDLKFCILRLYAIIESRLKQLIKEKQKEMENLKINQSEFEKFISKCLDNLIVYNCNTSEQYLLTLAACDHYIKIEQSTNKRLIPIFIDSINSNFEYIDKFLLKEQDHTQRFTISLLKQIIEKHNACVIATRNDYENEFSYSKWQSIVTKSILLEKQNGNNEFKLKIKSCTQANDNKTDIQYSIDSVGFHIIN